MIVTMQDYTITDRAPVLIGYEGENLSRNFTVKTFDDLSAIASIELLIGDVNCGAMTVNNTDDTEITISLDAFMIGRAGYKKAQLIMLDDSGAVIMKSNQFDVLVGASNNPRYYVSGEKVKTLTVNIDGRTRQIILPAGFAVSVNGDVAVDHIAFKAPDSYGDFDFSAAACRVDWTGVDGTSHTNICTEKDADGNWIWALPTALTRGGEGEISFSVSYIVTDATTGAVTADWNTGLVKFYHLESAKSDDAEEDVEEETTYDRLASAIAAVRAAQASVDDVNAILAGITSATPTVVDTVADLNSLDTSKVKFAIVAADGYLYYYDGTTWKSGFAYGGLQEVIAARTDSDGVTHADLKTRLNTAEAQIKEDLSAKASIIINASDEAEVVAFNDGADNMPMKSLMLKLIPHQEGSGDPSPSNVREITGYTSVAVHHNTSQSATGATAYHITFPSSAGTVYGGELDVVNGTLKVTHGIVDLGDYNNWTYNTTFGFFVSPTVSGGAPSKLGSYTDVWASAYTTRIVPVSLSQIPNNSIIYGSRSISSTPKIVVKDTRYTDESSFKTAVAGVKCVYPLATPTEITFDAVTIKTLLGSNTIWMDADGTIQADYPADTKLYIDALTAPDGDMVADSNIASGKYFTVNNRLYLSTTAIAQGEAIVVGTNCNQTDLATALNAINA